MCHKIYKVQYDAKNNLYSHCNSEYKEKIGRIVVPSLNVFTRSCQEARNTLSSHTIEA